MFWLFLSKNSVKEDSRFPSQADGYTKTILTFLLRMLIQENIIYEKAGRRVEQPLQQISNFSTSFW